MIGPKPVDLPPVEFTPAVREAIAERSGGVCEACGQARATNVHHRLYKSRGGRGTVTNGLALCGMGNTSGCHGLAHTGDGERAGLSVPSGSRPELWPVFLAAVGGWVLLLDERDSEGKWWSRPFGESVAHMLMNGGHE